MSTGHVAVIDIGKTNAKLALVDVADLGEVAVVTRPNKVLPGPPWPHFDVEGIWQFLLDALAAVHAEHRVDAISVTTHGACAALLDAGGELAAPILDYEHTGPDTVAAEYDAIRPPFSETGSPRLAGGLNLGAQLFWQFATVAELKRRTRTIVTYPQFWGFRLTGVTACDVSSLGTHTDLWNPHERCFSSLVEHLGLAKKMAPIMPSGAVLGRILPDIAARTGLSPDTPVYCGIHDSNASLLPHLLRHAPPFSVLSTGTWFIAMAIGGRSVTLDPSRDTLINVNALGDPVPSARFMGGREHDLASGGAYARPTDDDIRSVLETGIALLPAVVPETGPYAGRQAEWIGAEPEVGSGTRGAAIAFYLALVTSRCLDLVGHVGPVFVEGPLAGNRCFCLMLTAATGCEVLPMGGATGTSQGAALLVAGAEPMPAARIEYVDFPSGTRELVTAYIQTWRGALASGQPGSLP